MKSRYCSHCQKHSDHNKRTCPDRNRSREELQAERTFEAERFDGAADVIAKILDCMPAETRVALLSEAFARSGNAELHKMISSWSQQKEVSKAELRARLVH